MAKKDSGGKRGFPPSGFGMRLDQLLSEKGITQKKLAEAADIHPNTIAKMKAGLIEPSWPMVLALAKALGVDCTAFVGVAEAPSSKPAAKKKGGKK